MISRPLLVSAPAPATARPPPRRRHRLYLKAISLSSATSSSVLPHGGSSATRSLPQPHSHRGSLVSAQSQPPPLAAGAVRGDAATGLAFLLFVLSVLLSEVAFKFNTPQIFNDHYDLLATVMSSFLSLAIFSFPTWRALKQLGIAVHKLSKVVAEEVPGTLSSLKLSCLEINDFTSQLKNFRQRLMINIFGKNDSVDARSLIGWAKQGNI